MQAATIGTGTSIGTCIGPLRVAFASFSAPLARECRLPVPMAVSRWPERRKKEFEGMLLVVDERGGVYQRR